jgi:hypothetical protein
VCATVALVHSIGGKLLIECEPRERSLPVSDVLCRAGAQRTKLGAAIAKARAHADEAVGLAVRERVEQHRLHDTEHRGVGSDPERERDDGEEREQLGLHGGANPEAKILLQVADPVAPSLGAAVVREHLRALALHAANIAEALERRGARGGGIHSLRDVVADALLEMELQLVSDLGLGSGLERELGVGMSEWVAHDQLAQVGAVTVPTACVTAAAKRCHPVVCSWNWRFPSAVRW